MNPYTVLSPRLSQGLRSWKTLLGTPIDAKNAPFRRARLLLAAAFLEDVPSLRGDGEFMRQAALIRRVEWQQRLRFLSMLPSESPIERLLSALFMLTELTAAAAQAEPLPRARAVMDFLLPENCDMLYRAANLLSLEYGISADEVLSSQAELIPGRPCIAAHRHPYDDVRSPLTHLGENAGTLLHLYLLRAAARSVSRYAAAGACLENPQARALCAELSLILSEHATQYDGLLSGERSPQLRLLLRAYVGCCLYHGLAAQEDDELMRAAYAEAEANLCAHLRKARTLYTGKAPFESEEAPCLPILRTNKGYIRDVLSGIGLTLRRGERLPVGALPAGADFFRYQQRLNADLPAVPSHAVVTAHILKTGHDFRSELAPHPVEMLRDRAVDQVIVGR